MLAKSNKATKISEAGESVVLFTGVIHITIVCSHLLFPGFIPIEMGILRGSFMGVLFLWLSLGVRRRNRAIAVITVIAWGADTVLKYILNSGIASGPLFVRGGVTLGLLAGIVGCCMFRALLKSSKSDRKFSNEIIGGIPNISRARIITFSILSLIGLGAFVVELYRVLTYI